MLAASLISALRHAASGATLASMASVVRSRRFWRRALGESLVSGGGGNDGAGEEEDGSAEEVDVDDGGDVLEMWSFERSVRRALRVVSVQKVSPSFE